MICLNFPILILRELLCQHPENLRLVLTRTIYNELSTSRNPNNMSLIGVVFQTRQESAAKVSLLSSLNKVANNVVKGQICPERAVSSESTLFAILPILRPTYFHGY